MTRAIDAVKRYVESIPVTSMPVTHIGHLGDFSKPGTFRDKELPLVTRPKQLEKMRVLVKAPVRVNIWFFNKPTRTNFFFEKTTTAKFNRWAKQDVQVPEDPDGITFVIMGNYRGIHPLSPWMILHRCMHCVLESGFLNDSSILLTNFMVLCHSNYEYLIQNATMRSAREERARTEPGNLDSNELCAELLVQYLVKGKIVLNEAGKRMSKCIEGELNRLAKEIFASQRGNFYVTK